MSKIKILLTHLKLKRKMKQKPKKLNVQVPLPRRKIQKLKVNLVGNMRKEDALSLLEDRDIVRNRPYCHPNPLQAQMSLVQVLTPKAKTNRNKVILTFFNHNHFFIWAGLKVLVNFLRPLINVSN